MSEAGGPLHCRHCGEVIGVYEPMVVVRPEAPLHTSQAATREPGRLLEEPCFHAVCFAERQRD